MNRSARRRLRIGLSAAGIAACGLLIVLWVRSYYLSSTSSYRACKSGSRRLKAHSDFIPGPGHRFVL
jgi:hypothetical protein